MDTIFAKASNQAVTFAIRSGISLASGYAIKTITKFLDKLPPAEKKRIEKIRNKLHTKIEVLSISIDLIKLAAARGNTVLESTVSMINTLTEDIDRFQGCIEGITDELTGINQKDSIKVFEQLFESLESQINDVVPLLNLSLTTSGVNMATSLGSSISPGRLLQASNHIIKANESKHAVVGPTFDLVMYTIFYNPSRMKYIEQSHEPDVLSGITWKETFARASVTLEKANTSVESKYVYDLIIREDFNDGRYHEEEEEAKVKRFQVKNIQRMFFSASGKLLKLDQRNSPVLIVKIVEGENEEWIALGEIDQGEFDDEDDDDEDDEDEDKEKKPQITKATFLSLLEYLIRLTKMQQTQQKSILDIKDEVLAFYLQNESADLVPVSQREKAAEAAASSAKESVLSMDSNIQRLKTLDIK